MFRCCEFKTRSNDEFEEHLVSHPKCPECRLHFNEENTLQEHFRNFHSKVSCSLCNIEVLESEMQKHNAAHQTLKTYKSGLEMGRVRAKSNSDKPKPKRAITACNLFYKENRARLRSEHPNASPQEMFKIIGEAWKDADKKHWEKMAKEVNNVKETEGETTPALTLSCPFCERGYKDSRSFKQHMIDSHQANPSSFGVLNRDPSPGQGRIYKCYECGKLVTSAKDLKLHCDAVHSEEVLLMENVSTDQAEDELAEEITAAETSENPESEEQNVTANETTDNNTYPAKLSDIVFVKRKTIHWPGRVIQVEKDEIKVQILSTDSIVVKKRKEFNDIKPFEKNESLVKGRSTGWVSAYKEACKEST